MNIIDTGLKFNSNMSKMAKIEGIGLHHSGVSVLQSVETIHNYHKNTNKWAGIGYHYYVRKDGKVYKGRPEQYAGAHCPGINSNSIGICAEGDFNKEIMLEVQKKAIIELVLDIKKRHNIKWIKGHKEVLATTCPGKNYPLNEIKNAKPTSANNAQVQYSHKDFVKEVQKAIGANVDGIAGLETLSKTVTVSARKNNRHPVVKPIQKYLNSIGYTSVGVADGIAGVKFETAVKKFQLNNKCVTDGEITAKANTWKKLLKLA